MRLGRTALVLAAVGLGACSLLVDASGLQGGGGGEADGGGSSASSSGKSSASSASSSSGGGSSSSSSSSSSGFGSSSSGARDAAADACAANNATCTAGSDCCSGKCTQERRCKPTCASIGDSCFLTNGCCVGAYCGSAVSGTPACTPCRAKGQPVDSLAFPPASSCCSGTATADKCD